MNEALGLEMLDVLRILNPMETQLTLSNFIRLLSLEFFTAKCYTASKLRLVITGHNFGHCLEDCVSVRKNADCNVKKDTLLSSFFLRHVRLIYR